MPIPRSICSRIASGISMVMAAALLGGCAVPAGGNAVAWPADPEFARVRASARTDCKGNEIVGVWICSNPTVASVGIRAFVLLVRPDGTGLSRGIPIPGSPGWQGSATESFLWHYQGAGIWTEGTATIRFSGNALTVEGPAQDGTPRRFVYVRAGNESLNDVKPHS